MERLEAYRSYYDCIQNTLDELKPTGLYEECFSTLFNFYTDLSHRYDISEPLLPLSDPLMQAPNARNNPQLWKRLDNLTLTAFDMGFRFVLGSFEFQYAATGLLWGQDGYTPFKCLSAFTAPLASFIQGNLYVANGEVSDVFTISEGYLSLAYLGKGCRFGFGGYFTPPVADSFSTDTIFSSDSMLRVDLFGALLGFSCDAVLNTTTSAFQNVTFSYRPKLPKELALVAEPMFGFIDRLADSRIGLKELAWSTGDLSLRLPLFWTLDSIVPSRVTPGIEYGNGPWKAYVRLPIQPGSASPLGVTAGLAMGQAPRAGNGSPLFLEAKLSYNDPDTLGTLKDVTLFLFQLSSRFGFPSSRIRG